MNVVVFLSEQIKQAHGFLEATMEGVTPEQAHWIPPGTANPLSATYVHAVVSEDTLIHAVMQGSAPLHASTCADQTGISEIQPLSAQEWARRLRVDLPTLRRYAQAVYAATDAYVAALTDEDLSRVIDLSGIGMGQQTVGNLLSRFVVGHVDNLCGEISCLKGLQGGRGYPI